jgi:uncharacterized protein YndB with AHSA1/START domain
MNNDRQTESSTGTVRILRVFKAPPERIYRAILDPAANCKWLPPHGFTCTVHQLDASVGGSYKMTFENFSTGSSHSFQGKYLELVPGERIVATDLFDDPNLPGQMTTTYTFRKVSVGTEVSMVQDGIPAAIPTEACYLGWQECLEQLANLVEPDIPDM